MGGALPADRRWDNRPTNSRAILMPARSLSMSIESDVVMTGLGGVTLTSSGFMT
jgi:hypothetical protein